MVATFNRFTFEKMHFLDILNENFVKGDLELILTLIRSTRVAVILT